MCVNWKKAAALGLAVLIGGMMPMSTMFAAEKEAGIDAGSMSENGLQPEDADLAALAMESNAGAKEAEPQDDDDDDDDEENTGVPQITVKRDGNDCTRSLGGQIDYEYVKYWGPQVSVSVSNDQLVSVFWYLDSVTDTETEAKTEEQMDSLKWEQRQNLSETILLPADGRYVVYFKVEAGGQKYYARSRGIVVDTAAPKIKEAVSGEPFVPGQTYPSDTQFLVEDANLDTVKINERKTEPLADGKYQVTVQEHSTSCVIRAIDKAGNETVCNISVAGSEPPESDNNVISESKAYSLKAGVKYHLAAGKWKVEGDSSVYPGDSDFYVKTDGTYSFSK